MFQQITILGPGLLGASIAMAVKQAHPNIQIQTWSRRAETRQKSQNTDWCDQVFSTAAEAVKGSDLVIICTPVATIVPLLEAILDHLQPQACVTDVGSTKAEICQAADHLFADSEAHFIGSHPMAGSAQSGMEHANASLLQAAYCLITPQPHTPAEHIERLVDFWRQLHMQPQLLSASEHDRIVAHISHLPHFLASSLAWQLAQKPNNWTQYCGGGLRDSTRIASGDPTLWQQIFQQNKDEVLKAVEGLERSIADLKQALNGDDLSELFQRLQQAKNYRDQL
ncbi:MAG: prephenate dehydrogenase [Opitutales bacterium]